MEKQCSEEQWLMVMDLLVLSSCGDAAVYISQTEGSQWGGDEDMNVLRRLSKQAWLPLSR